MGRQDRRRGVSQLCDPGQTFNRLRREYAGMAKSDVRRLNDRKRENFRLKRLLAHRDLEIDVVKNLVGRRV